MAVGDSGRPGPRVLGAWLLALGALLLALFVRSATEAPERYGQEDLVWQVDTDLLRHDAGMAYLVPVEASIPSSIDGGESPLLVQEDGRALVRDNLHREIRDHGGGRYSHWGDVVYLAATDGTDPRTNGRVYEFVLPGEGPATIGPWLARLLFAAMLALVVASRLWRGTLSRITLALVAVVVVLAWSDLREPTVDMPSVEEATLDEALVLGDGERVLPVPGGRGNVTRMSEPVSPWAFESGAPAPIPLEPVHLTLSVESHAERVGEMVVLGSRSESAVVGVPDRKLLAIDLAEIIVQLRILEGTSIEVDFVQSADAVSKLESITLPVRPGPDTQTLRISEPLGDYLGAGHLAFEGLRICLPASSRERVVVDVQSVILNEDAAMFRRAAHGNDAVRVAHARRLATWQSAVGQFTVNWPATSGRVVKLGVAAIQAGAKSGVASYAIGWQDAAGETHGLADGTVEVGAAWSDLRLRLPDDVSPSALVMSVGSMSPGVAVAWSVLRVVDDARPPRRILFTLMDTLRADAVSSYGGSLARTPSLDALASHGVRFHAAISQCYWTLPSVVSLMTGLYGPSTGVHVGADRLPPSYTTLAEVFAESGFYTSAFITNANAGPEAGLAQGWDHLLFRNISPDCPDAAALLDGEVEPALSAMEDEDLLLYVHLMDAHDPYGPYTGRPSDWVLPVGGQALERDRQFDHDWVAQPTDLTRRSLYRFDVELMDAQWGSFVARLLTRWDGPGVSPTVVVVASDHGEYLGEYGRWSHVSHVLSPEVVRVPLIIRAPGVLPTGVTIDAPVENLDIGPTLMSLMGIEHGAWQAVDGRDLTGLVLDGGRGLSEVARSSALTERGLFAEYRSDSALLGAGGELDSLLGAPWGVEPSRDGLGDPRDALDVPARGRARFSEEWKAFLDSRAATKTRMWADVDESATQLDAATLQQLRELGYLK